MKPTEPSTPLDDLMAAALDRDLTPEERTQFEARLQNDPAARAAYEEAKTMHTLLEGTYTGVQPDPAFEQRMVSGVRRRLRQGSQTETPLESMLVLWRALKAIPGQVRFANVIIIGFVIVILFGVATGPITSGIKKAKERADLQARREQLANNGISDPSQVYTIGGVIDADNGVAKRPKKIFLPPTIASASALSDVPLSGKLFQSKAPTEVDYTSANEDKALQAPKNLKDVLQRQGINYVETAQNGITLSGYVDSSYTTRFAGATQQQAQQSATSVAEAKTSAALDTDSSSISPLSGIAFNNASPSGRAIPSVQTKSGEDGTREAVRVFPYTKPGTPDLISAPTVTTQNGLVTSIDKAQEYPQPQPLPKPKIAGKNGSDGNAATTDTDVTRKLIRNADLELEVKSFQTAIDGITALSKAAGGYVDSSNSQRGGNGKLQGTIIIKVLPGNLDAVLLKLRDLGEVRNQSVKTDDVTKDYYDTVARLDNSRKTEEQLQELLKRNNGKVSELLQVERELGRVRGEIEQMQGSLKFYDFLVQYATITIALKEKDLNQAAAYLLQEQDTFSLFATDVEATFKKARQTAEDCKAQILNATLTHNSGSDVQAELVVMVPPDQIESFLTQIRGLGRIANFTRQSQRVAKDGGDSDNPADQTLTEKDKVQVHLSIRSDDESRKQVALVVVTPKVDDALDQAKTTALANAGTEILTSSLNRTEQGQSSGQLRVRVPGKSYQTLLDAFRALGRTASFSLQRDDNSGPGANGDEAPVIISLALTDTDVPLQLTEMSVIVPQVDDQAQQIKKDAATSGVEIKTSSFSRQPDGREVAQLSFRLPMSKYPAFVDSLKNRGKVEVFTVNRSDRPDQTRADATAPVEINLVLHNQAALIADNTGLWATLRETFGEGAGALFSSIRTIGVLIAFVAPWLVTLIFLAWLGRRLYLWRKK